MEVTDTDIHFTTSVEPKQFSQVNSAMASILCKILEASQTYLKGLSTQDDPKKKEKIHFGGTVKNTQKSQTGN